MCSHVCTYCKIQFTANRMAMIHFTWKECALRRRLRSFTRAPPAAASRHRSCTFQRLRRRAPQIRIRRFRVGRAVKGRRPPAERRWRRIGRFTHRMVQPSGCRVWQFPGCGSLSVVHVRMPVMGVPLPHCHSLYRLWRTARRMGRLWRRWVRTGGAQDRHQCVCAAFDRCVGRRRRRHHNGGYSYLRGHEPTYRCEGLANLASLYVASASEYFTFCQSIGRHYGRRNRATSTASGLCLWKSQHHSLPHI